MTIDDVVGWVPYQYHYDGQDIDSELPVRLRYLDKHIQDRLRAAEEMTKAAKDFVATSDFALSGSDGYPNPWAERFRRAIHLSEPSWSVEVAKTEPFCFEYQLRISEAELKESYLDDGGDS